MNHPAFPSRAWTVVLPLALALLAAVALSFTASAQAKSCSTPSYPGSGYFTSLTATGTSCANGRKIAVAHNKCRRANGGIKGRCTRKVLRYSCTEKRQSIPTEINARVTCRRGSARVVFTYQQNT